MSKSTRRPGQNEPAHLGVNWPIGDSWGAAEHNGRLARQARQAQKDLSQMIDDTIRQAEREQRRQQSKKHQELRRSMNEDEARHRLVAMVAEDIVSHGWKIKKVRVSNRKSTYLDCRKKSLELTVRIADHAPSNEFNGISIHPGGKQRKHLIRRLSRRVPLTGREALTEQA